MAACLTDSWLNCYSKGWSRNRLRPASFAHPAKAAYGLTVRIYEHALEEGWIKPGDYLVDCFAGVGGFALEAMRHGLNFVGVELEQRFVDMGQGCDCTGISKADWVRFQGRWDKARYRDGRHWCPECVMKASIIADEWKNAIVDKRKIKPVPLPGTKWAVLAKMRQATMLNAAPSTSYVRNSGQIPCTEPHRYHGNIETWEAQGMPGTAVIVQGDSRRLGEVLERANLCLSSPPYAGLRANIRGHGIKGTAKVQHDENYGNAEYGSAPGQLSNLPDTGFEAALAVSSPAYIGNTASDDPDKRGGLYRDPKRRGDKTLTATYSKDEAQLAQMPRGDLALALGSPPFIGSIHEGGHGIDVKKLAGNKAGPNSQALIMDGYGREPGQLAVLPEGSHAEVCKRPAIAISSPPYIESLERRGQSPEVVQKRMRQKGWSEESIRKVTVNSNDTQSGYGEEEGQLAQMPPGDHAAALEAGAETGRAELCLSSPPYEGSINAGRNDDNARQRKAERHARGEFKCKRPDVFSSQSNIGARGMFDSHYGDTEGQIGKETGSTFWAASRQILEEVYQVLTPGAHAIWVVKAFVRNKAVVNFPDQWRELCESVGFCTLHEHHAILTEDRGAQHTLDGGLDVRQVKRASFFRRLHESKYPHLAINHEVVLCMVKPS